jgi:hypothetical protein
MRLRDDAVMARSGRILHDELRMKSREADGGTGTTTLLSAIESVRPIASGP